MIQGFSSGLLNRELIYQTDLPSFQRDFASLKTLDHGTGPAITFTRASGATYFDADGVLQTATNDTPRFDHDPVDGGKSLGLLIEEARTNSIRNSQGGGAVVGASGTMPTNWFTNLITGISREVVATGTVNGFSYIDIKLSGTNTSGSAGFLQINPEALTQVVAASGQSWSASAYIALIAGNFSGTTSPFFRIVERDAVGAAIAGAISSTDISTANATLSRFSVSRTLNGAGVERVTTQLVWTVANGASVDFTVRIAAPQLEQGAFPTSYIPTTTAAATRAADSAVVTPISSFYNASEGTLFAEASSTAFVSGDNQGLWGFGDDTLTFATGNMMYATHAASVSHRIAIGVIVSGASTVSSLNNGGVPQSANVPARSIFGYKTDDFAISTNGSSVATDTSGALPVVTGFSIGGLQKAWASGGNQLNGHIRKIAYWPKRLTNTLLQQLTT